MKIAVFSREYKSSTVLTLQRLFDSLARNNFRIFVFESLARELKEKGGVKYEGEVLQGYKDLVANSIDYVLSVGGDGTLLETLLLVRDSGIPVGGINTGRLGFLSNTPESEVETAIEDLRAGNYYIEARTLLKCNCDKELFKMNYALNDFTIHKRDNTSMLIIKTFLNGDMFNTYWADGIIVSTPTGSTAYSLSCGGPVIFPGSKTFSITPVAPHNLNVRPIVISDESIISFEISGRGSNYLVSLDSRSEIIDYSWQLAVSKADFTMNLIRFHNQNFISTLRNKLMWGIDSRNN
ncbi:MAG: NAD kinase [Bacteroidia bacterium]